MEFIINTIFWTLAIYGFFEIVKTIINLFTYTNFQSDGIYLIIAVKNQEEKIEGFLRSSLFKILYLKSEDRTKEIAKKMESEYECLKVTTWKECIDIIDNVNET